MSGANKQVIILGRGRCGTSLLGSILEELGVKMGNSRPAGKNNIWGYYEDTGFNMIVDSHLPDDVHYADQDLITHDPEFEEEFKRYVEARDDGNWGFKNGSGLYFLPLIVKHLPNPHFIIARRDLDAQAQSVQYALSTYMKTVAQCKQSIENYNYKMETFFSFHDYPRLDVWYEDVVYKTDQEVKKIASFLELPYKKVKSVDPKLKHY